MPKKIHSVKEPEPSRTEQKNAHNRPLTAADTLIAELARNPEQFAALSAERREDKIFVVTVINKKIDISPWIPAILLKDRDVVLAVIANLPEGRRREEFIHQAIETINTDEQLMRRFLQRNPSFLNVINPIIKEDIALQAKLNRKMGLTRQISPHVPRHPRNLMQWITNKSLRQPLIHPT